MPPRKQQQTQSPDSVYDQKFPRSLLKEVSPEPPIKRVDFNRGLITKASVSENIVPETTVSDVENMNFDIIGSMQVRQGLTLVGNQLSGNILGLQYFSSSTSGKSQLFTVNGNTGYYLNGNTWTSLRTGLTSGSKARFTSFLNFLWMVNGTESTAIWDGTGGGSFVTTGNASGAPKGNFIENYRDRVWISGNSSYPDRVYYTTVPSAAATPVVTWNTDPVTGSWIDISPQDGEAVTGLKRSKTALLVFKNNHIYRIYSVNSTDPDPQINVGTYSNESIVEGIDGIYFHHPSGFYKYSSDGTVSLISKPISDITAAITLANSQQVVGWEELDKDHIAWTIGTITLTTPGKKIQYTNAVVRYTISTQVWTLYTYPTQFMASAMRYSDGTSLFTLVGDSAGSIFKVNTGFTDNGSAIPFRIIHQNESLDGMSSTTKTIEQIAFIHVGGSGAKVTWQNSSDQLSDFTKPLATLKQYDTLVSGESIKGRDFYLQVSGSSSGDPFIYEGYEVLKWYVSESEYMNP